MGETPIYMGEGHLLKVYLDKVILIVVYVLLAKSVTHMLFVAM